MVRAAAAEGKDLPCLDFVAEAVACPRCGGALRAQKSKRRQVVTLAHGPFTARELRKQCRAHGCHPLQSAALAQLIKPGQRFGYDLVVQVGLSRYLAGMQREEIRRMLRNEHGIELSDGSVSALCDRFLGYLEALHVTRAPVLREALAGGYPLHLDATCERGKGGLFVCLDGWHGWVLGSARVTSEAGANLAPVVERTVQLFGKPVATVRDLGDGCAHAVASLREEGIPDLVCHYHFLAAVGNRLFQSRYDTLRAMIRQTECRSELHALLRDLRKYSSTDETEGRFGKGTVRDELKALLLWVLEGDGHADAAFPFALPLLDFARRCRQAAMKAEPWVSRPRSTPERRAIACLERLVDRLESTESFSATVGGLESRRATFQELRGVLRLTNAELPRGDTRTTQEHLPALELLRLQQIKQSVVQYTADLEGRIGADHDHPKTQRSTAGIILRYLRRYEHSLFGHPAKLDEEGRVLAVVQRTNNVAEHFFGRQKQQLRRRVGRGQLGRDLEKQPAQVALVANLRDPEYVRLLAGSLDQLPAAIARLDQDASAEIPELVRDHRDSQLQAVIQQLLEVPSPELAERSVVRAHKKEEPRPRDPRLPPPGSVLERWFRGRSHRIEVLEHGFRYRNTIYKRPAKLVRKIAGTQRDSYHFLGLTMPWTERAATLRGRRLCGSTMIDLPAPTEF